MKRADIVAEARTWIGTPFQHAQSCKGHGTDCVGLCIGVYKALGGIPKDWYPAPYSQQWHVHKNEELLVQTVAQFGFREIPVAECRPGDLLFFKFGRVCSHVGLYVGNDQMIHAFFSLQRAVQQPLTGDLGARLRIAMVCPWVED